MYRIGGDWEHGLSPFYSIEWLRVSPKYLKYRGRLIEPESFDITDEFTDILQQLKIPFVQEGKVVCIYGYVENTGVFN